MTRAQCDEKYITNTHSLVGGPAAAPFAAAKVCRQSDRHAYIDRQIATELLRTTAV